jgi:hypothetical protein
MGCKVPVCPTVSPQGTLALCNIRFVFEILANRILNGKRTDFHTSSVIRHFNGLYTFEWNNCCYM